MATQTIEFRAATGQTVTAKLFSAGSDTQIASASATEETNRKGTYTVSYTNVPTGEYILIALVGTIPIASWWVRLELSTATYQVYDKSDTLGTADAVWDESMSSHNINGSYGSHVVRSQNQNQNTVQITGSNHIAADMHESQPGSIHSTTFELGAINSGVLDTDAITSNTLSSSAIAELQYGLAGSGQLATECLEIKDRQGYTLAILAGSISNAGSATETYVINIGDIYTVAYSGLTSLGNRGGVSLNKS
jgi:hypothetical protein